MVFVIELYVLGVVEFDFCGGAGVLVDGFFELY